MQRIRKRIIFYGQVQGVGFRYRARYAAQACGVTGWVKNEYDGSVTMEVQGTEDAIDQMLLLIEKGSYIRISNLRVKTLPLETESGFHIR